MTRAFDDDLEYGFATRAIHAGQRPEPLAGAIMTPVYLTSTYVQEGLGQNKGYEYARGRNPTREALERNVAALEGGRHGDARVGGHRHVVGDGALEQPGVVVGDDHGPAGLIEAQGGQRDAVDRHLAAGRLDRAVEAGHQRRGLGRVGGHDADDLAGLDLEVDALERAVAQAPQAEAAGARGGAVAGATTVAAVVTVPPRGLTEMPALWAYARDLYQTPGFGETVDFEQIKQHYYIVHTMINPTQIVPKGPDPEVWLTPHGRG